jgi:hypothetical protein
MLLYPLLMKLCASGEALTESILRAKVRCEQRAEMYFRTLQRLKMLWNDHFLVLKTYDSYPYQANDLDVLVRRDVVRFRSVCGTIKMRHDSEDVLLLGDALLPVDAYKKIAYGTRRALVDNDLMWASPRRITLGSVSALLPSTEGDLASLFAHMACKYSFTLAELLSACHLAEKCNMRCVIDQAEKNRWRGLFNETAATINWFHRVLFGFPSSLEDQVPSLRRVRLQLPYLSPLPSALGSMMSQRALGHALLAIPEYWKAYQMQKGKRYRLLGNLLNVAYYTFLKTLISKRL